MFLAAALVGGLAFVVVTPPLGAPDEHVHLARAFLVAEGRMIPPGKAPWAQAAIPRSLMALNRAMAHPPPTTPPLRYSVGDVTRLFEQPLEPEQRVPAGYLGLYSPLAYAPQALAIALLRPLEPSPLGLLYAGRLANLAAYAAAGWLALALAPVRRWSLCLLLLLPMSLAQASSLSPDAATLAAGCLLFAVATRAAFGQDVRLGGRLALGLVGAAALVALMKPGYVVLAGLALAIPRERFDSSRQRWVWVAAILAAALVPTFAWAALVRASDVPLPSPLADPSAQLSTLLQHPTEFAAAVAATLAAGGGRFLASFVGKLGLLNVPLPAPIVTLAPLVLVGAALTDPRDPASLRARDRLLCALLFGLGFVGVFALAYVGWNQPGTHFVQGIQGRYFTPLVPLLLLALPAHGLALPGEVRARAAVLWVTLSLGAAALALRYAFYF